MNGRALDRRWNNEQSTEMLDVLSQSDTPALATDIGGHIVFWNRAAERLLGRPTNQVLGRRCYDVFGGRDVFGIRFCHEKLLHRLDDPQGRVGAGVRDRPRDFPQAGAEHQRLGPEDPRTSTSPTSSASNSPRSRASA